MSRKIGALALLAAVIGVLGLAASQALASRALNLEPGGNVRISEQYMIRFSAFEGTSVICNITLEMELERRIAKRERERFGEVVGSRVNSCRSSRGEGNNSITFLVEERRHWRMQYSSFSGILPNITAVQIRIPEFAVLARIDTRPGTTGCLWEGNAEFIFEAPRASRMRALEAGSILRRLSVLENGLLGCPSEIFLIGSTALSPTQTFSLAA